MVDCRHHKNKIPCKECLTLNIIQLTKENKIRKQNGESLHDIETLKETLKTLR